MVTHTPRTVAAYDLPAIIGAEFDEQPGLRLTFAQVKRLWNLSTDECNRVLAYMISLGQLVQDDDDRYCRPSARVY